MAPETRVTVVILAAQRAGGTDPIAERAGVSHKCVAPIAGKPLIVHVMDALRGIEEIAAIRIVIEPEAVGAVRALGIGEADRVAFVESAENLADSVYAGAAGVETPVIVTTADNVLLRAEPLREVFARLRAGDDVVVAFARREAVLATHPEAQRNFYKLADGQYSNCNLYGLSRAGLRAAEAFRGGGQFAKNPGRIVKAFGLLNSILLRLGAVSLATGMKRLSRRFGVRMSAVVLADGAYAVDVDNERTYRIAEMLLERRAASLD